MSPLYRTPIRLQLIIIVALVALPAAAMITFSELQHEKEAIQHARKDTQNIVEMVASEQQLLVASAQQLLLTLSQLPEINYKDSNGTNVFLRRILRLHPDFINIFVADPSGMVWASALPSPRGISVSDRRYFKNAVATGQPSSGEFHIGRLSHVPTLNFGYPYWNDKGNIAGVICVGLDLQKNSDVLKLAQVPKESNLFMFDYKGIIFFSTKAHKDIVGKMIDSLHNQIIIKGAKSNKTQSLTINNAYVSYKGLYLNTETMPYAYVVMEIPMDAILSETKQTMQFQMITFMIILASALSLAWLIGKKSIADRIFLLEMASRKVAEGVKGVMVSRLVKGGELGRLGESFDDMASQLQSREERLSESRRFLNAIIDTEPACLMLLDSEGRFLLKNRAGLNMFEADSFEDIKTTTILNLVTIEYKDQLSKLIAEVFKGHPRNLEYEAVGLKGRHIWLDLHAVPFRNEEGEVVSLLGISPNVTDRHIAMQELFQRESDLKYAQKIAKLGSWTYEMSGKLKWSDELYHIYGVSPEDFTPTLENFLHLIHPEDKSSMEGWISAAIEGRNPEELIFRINLPNGTLRFISGRGELTYDAGGTPIRMSGTAQDITERKQAEDALAEKQQQLEELNKSLEHRIAEAVKELRKKDEILIQQSRQAAMGETLGNIAHQWRQPLNALGLLVQELKMTYGSEEFSKQSLDASVQKAMTLITYMSRTIDDFRNFFKPSKDKTFFSVTSAVNRTLSLIEPSFKNRNIEIDVSVLQDSDINGYINEYSQVLLNILQNCRDAFEERHIDMRRVVNLTVFREDGKSVVTIADNAGGISEDIIDRIFDPYFTTKGPDKGTGIGLYMSKNIIEKHMDGRISARNIEGGAEFRIEMIDIHTRRR